MKTWSLGVVLATALDACGGGNGAAVGNAGQQAISASPSSATYTGNSGQSTSIAVSGGSGGYTVSTDKPSIVALSTVSGSSFVVTPVAGGTAAVAVKDSQGDSATVSVNVNVCEPPTPAFGLEYPANQSSVSGSFGTLWVSVRNGDPVNSVVPQFYPRLIAANGTVVNGGAFTMTSSQPPAGSTLPVGGYTTYAVSTMPALAPGATYQIQIADANYQCIPPIMIGSVST